MYTEKKQYDTFIYLKKLTNPKPIFSLFQNSTQSFLERPKNSKEKGKTLNKVSRVFNSYVKQEGKKKIFYFNCDNTWNTWVLHTKPKAIKSYNKNSMKCICKFIYRSKKSRCSKKQILFFWQSKNVYTDEILILKIVTFFLLLERWHGNREKQLSALGIQIFNCLY